MGRIGLAVAVAVGLLCGIGGAALGQMMGPGRRGPGGPGYGGHGGMMGGGMMGSGTMMDPAAGTSDLATAMTQFIGSTLNESGGTQTDVQKIIDQFGKSNGTL